MPRCPSCHRRVASSESCPDDGAKPAIHAPQPDPGAWPIPALSGFGIGALLAVGGFSTLWSAVRLEDGAATALKVSRAHHLLSRERFRCEAAALEQLGAPWSPQLYQHGVLEDGRPYLALEALQGETLAARLEALPSPPDLRQAVDLATAVLGCLEATHARGLIHQDLAPENVFLEATGGVRLLDFGLAQRDRGVARHPADSALNTLGRVAGTPGYMPPERLRGEPVDARADVYAFGALLFELLTLRTLFTGDRAGAGRSHLGCRPSRPGEDTPVPPPLAAIVRACLARERTLRPPNVGALRAALVAARSALFGARNATDATDATDAAPASSSADGAAPTSDAGVDERYQQTVLMAVEARGAEAEILGAVARHEGMLVRQRGYRFVAMFPGESEAAARRALLAGREIVNAVGAPAAIHLAPLKLRREPDGTQTAHGLPVERPESWLPAEAWRGIALSAELVGAEPGFDISAASEDGCYFFVLDPPPLAGALSPPAPALPLVGRNEVLLRLAMSRAGALGGEGPALCALTGERGLGRSRLADEAAAEVRRALPEALVIPLRAEAPAASVASLASPGSVTGGFGQTARALLAALLDTPDGLIPADPRGRCVERLGQTLGEDVFPAVAACLGWHGEGAPRAWRGSVIRAIAEGLRHQALIGPVVVVLDDAHLADGFALDALALATRPETPLPLWILLTGTPALLAGSRRLRAREEVALAPLDAAPARALCATLLEPAEHPPQAALERICAWAGNNPLCLVELTRALKRAGFVRMRARLSSCHFAAAELEKLPPSPAWQWFAAGQLDALTPELAAGARICAVLGFELADGEVESVQRALEHGGERGGAAAPLADVNVNVNVDAALASLAALGVLRRRDRASGPAAPPGGASYAFRSALLQEALYTLLDEPYRVEVHRHALARWEALAGGSAPTPALLEPVARHAAACGARSQAANAHLLLGDLRRDEHQNATAASHYTSALLWADGDDQRRRYLALVGRARVRSRVLRTGEALEDLRAAGALARTMDDPRLIAEALLEEATALDWAGAWDDSALRVDEALPLLEGHGDAALAARIEVAAGRSCWRRGNLTEAIDRLARGAAKAHGADHDAYVVALILLACAFVRCGRLEQAEQRFAQAIARCEDRGDRVHLCAALGHRVELWVALNEPDQAIEDLGRAVALAREEGTAWAERTATLKLAELLYIWGREDEALPLVRRARALDEQFMDRPVYDGALLLARIHAMRHEHAEASRQLRWLRAHWAASDLSPYARSLLGVMQLAVRDPRSGSESARARAALREEPEPTGELLSPLTIDERIELLFWRARALIDAGRPEDVSVILSRAGQLLGESRVWRPRFDALRASPGRLAG